MSTIENLKAAFAGESQANRRYLAFAQRAEDEGNITVAKLFRAAAEGETVHALNHLSALKEIRNSRANIEGAIAGETYEIDKMYPGFIKEAEKENSQEALLSFNRAIKVEKFHQGLFQKALDKIKNGEDPEEGEYYVCQVCGYPALNSVPDNCPVCGAPRTKFKIVDE
jgi:rubrerythrin